MVSIIIPVRFRPDLVRVCLDSIIKYTNDVEYEIIVVQEGHDDEMTTMLADYPNIKFTYNPQPKGFSGAMNTGLEISQGDYFCFLNSDIVAIPGWLSEMMKAFDDVNVGLITPTFTESKTKQNVDYNSGENAFDY